MTSSDAAVTKPLLKLLPMPETRSPKEQKADVHGPSSIAKGRPTIALAKEDYGHTSNPLPYIVKGFALIATLLGSFGLWAATAPLDSGVVAPGVVIVSGRRQEIAHPQGGVVSEIFVKEGTEVKEGDILLRLESIRARAAFDIAQSAYDTAIAEESRLLSELNDQERTALPLEMWARAAVNGDVERILQTQNKLFAARRKSIAGERDIIQSQIEQSQNEIDSVQANQISIERQEQLVVEELTGQQTLLEEGLTEKSRVIALKRDREQLRGARAENTARLAQLENRTNELRLGLAQREKAFNEETMARLREVQSKMLEQRESLNNAHDVLNKIEIRAPSDGVVVEMRINTAGDVVGAGNVLLDLVPSTRELVIDAKVPVTDIDSITVGQDVRIILPAFNQVTTPTLHGTVSHVSSDRIVEETSAEAPYFRAYVSVTEQELKRLGEGRLQAGMSADLIIRTGERTALEYLLGPIIRIMAKAWREA